MRIWTGLAIAGAIAFSAPAGAQDWCGFRDTENSQVRCGYSSLQECKQALTDRKDSDKKDGKSGNASVVCLPDPSNG